MLLIDTLKRNIWEEIYKGYDWRNKYYQDGVSNIRRQRKSKKVHNISIVVGMDWWVGIDYQEFLFAFTINTMLMSEIQKKLFYSHECWARSLLHIAVEWKKRKLCMIHTFLGTYVNRWLRRSWVINNFRFFFCCIEICSTEGESFKPTNKPKSELCG